MKPLIPGQTTVRNEQRAEELWLDPDGMLKVFKVWRTIQGEGPLSGMPAVFVRLAGCNLQCPWCDTDYTSTARVMPLNELISEVCKCSTSGLVVLTGGEPLRQRIGPFVRRLVAMGRTVQIETNGTLFQPVVSTFGVCVVCSPKTALIDKRLQAHVDNWKYVVKAGGLAPDGLPKGVARPASSCRGSIWVQPMDEGDPLKNKRNVDAAVKSCLEHGYRLTLQVHKIVGVE